MLPYFAFVNASLSSNNLSFRPNLHSGVPDRYARIRICPETSARRTVPVGKKWINEYLGRQFLEIDWYHTSIAY